ncbi:hypothetical protein D3C81_1784640 [compost metagenome]
MGECDFGTAAVIIGIVNTLVVLEVTQIEIGAGDIRPVINHTGVGSKASTIPLIAIPQLDAIGFRISEHMGKVPISRERDGAKVADGKP